MKTIEVYSLGMNVLLLGEIEAKIAEIAIGNNDAIQYRLVYVKDQQRISIWVQAVEIEPNGEEYKLMLKVINPT